MRTHISQAIELISWTKSIGGKFFRLVPFYTAAIILTTNVAKVSQILSMLLPLKILMILSSGSIPSFFPDLISHSDTRTWVMCLSILAATCYVIYISSQRLVIYWSGQASGYLLDCSAKLSLFPNQDKIAADSYLKYSQLLSGAVFVSVLIFFIWFLYPEILLLLSVYVGLTICGFLLLVTCRPAALENIGRRLSGLGTIFSATGFMLVFCFMVNDYLTGSEKNFLTSIIVLLVSRIWLTQLSVSVIGVINLHRNKFQLHSLFFHGRPVESIKRNNQKHLLELIDPKSRSEWISAFINERTQTSCKSYNVVWIELGLAGIAVFEVEAVHNKSSQSCRYLLKIYDRDKCIAARQEVELLQDVTSDFPSLRLITSGEIDECVAILYSLNGMQKLSPTDCPARMDEFKKCLVANHPTASFIDRYQRSKTTLGHRLNNQFVDDFKHAITNADDLDILKDFEKSLPYLQSMLAELSCYVYCPYLINEGFYLDSENRPILVHWSGWRIESLGAGWHTSEVALTKLDQAISEYLGANEPSTSLIQFQATLAAMCFEIEQMLERWRFTHALSLMASVNAIILDRKNTTLADEKNDSAYLSAASN